MTLAAASLSLMPDEYPAQRPATRRSPPAHNNSTAARTSSWQRVRLPASLALNQEVTYMSGSKWFRAEVELGEWKDLFQDALGRSRA